MPKHETLEAASDDTAAQNTYILMVEEAKASRRPVGQGTVYASAIVAADLAHIVARRER